jgi:hypothetical protein
LEFFDLAKQLTGGGSGRDGNDAAYAVGIADIEFILGESEFAQGASVLDRDGLVEDGLKERQNLARYGLASRGWNRMSVRGLGRMGGRLERERDI